MITAEQVKNLRDKTSVSVMQCKKALEEANGDFDMALMILKKKSSEVALKKADRETKDGIIVAKNSGNKTSLVVLNCETDFVAKNEDFLALANALADKALAEGTEKTTADAPEMISSVVQKTGENIQLGKIEVFENAGVYVHGGKKACVVLLHGGTSEIARDIAMHATAMNPEYLSIEEVPEKDKMMATEMFMKEVADIDKSEEIKKKMLEGKLGSYFKEKALLSQPYIKNPEMTVGALAEKSGAVVASYTLYSI